MPGAEAATPHVPAVHAVTTDEILLRADFVATARDVLQALGAHGALHVRARRLADRRVVEIVSELRAAASDMGCMIVVNDRVDIALGVHADAVQLTSRSAPITAVREMAPTLRIGASVHSASEARDAGFFGADWCVAGHVFSSATHRDEPERGIDFVRACAEATEIPVLAIGGVLPHHVSELLGAGAHGVACISGIWDAPNPGASAGRYLSEHVAAHHRE